MSYGERLTELHEALTEPVELLFVDAAFLCAEGEVVQLVPETSPLLHELVQRGGVATSEELAPALTFQELSERLWLLDQDLQQASGITEPMILGSYADGVESYRLHRLVRIMPTASKELGEDLAVVNEATTAIQGMKSARVYALPTEPKTPKYSAAEERELVNPRTWRRYAACLGIELDVFFPIGEDTPAIDAAKEICNACTVRTHCLEFAITTRQDEGVWGGLAEDERRKYRRRTTRLRRSDA